MGFPFLLPPRGLGCWLFSSWGQFSSTWRASLHLNTHAENWRGSIDRTHKFPKKLNRTRGDYTLDLFFFKSPLLLLFCLFSPANEFFHPSKLFLFHGSKLFFFVFFFDKSFGGSKFLYHASPEGDHPKIIVLPCTCTSCREWIPRRFSRPPVGPRWCNSDWSPSNSLKQKRKNKTKKTTNQFEYPPPTNLGFIFLLKKENRMHTNKFQLDTQKERKGPGYYLKGKGSRNFAAALMTHESIF